MACLRSHTTMSPSGKLNPGVLAPEPSRKHCTLGAFVGFFPRIPSLAHWGFCAALIGRRAVGTWLSPQGAGLAHLSLPFPRSMAEALASPYEKQKEILCLLHSPQQCPLFFSVFLLKEVVVWANQDETQKGQKVCPNSCI